MALDSLKIGIILSEKITEMSVVSKRDSIPLRNFDTHVAHQMA
jgi:hypothetical protein